MEHSPVPRLLLLLALPVFFIGLGANSIWDANEAFYVETPRQMVLSGDYLNPSFNGEPRFNKPVLSYWIVAAGYRLFGESVTVERVAIAMGAMGIILAAFLMGRALRSTTTGVLAALFVATAPRIVFFSRRILIDVYITMFMAIALAAFVLAERHPERRRLYLLLMYVAIGLGVLTKGPMAAGLPLLVGAAWLLTERRLPDVRRLMILPGAVIVLAIVLPWYAAIYAQHGWEYIRQFFVDENLGRFASPVTTARSPLFFIPALFADILLPWAPLLLVPMASAWRRGSPADVQGGLRRLLWWWVLVIVVVFSVSASKEDLYIFPAIPAAAVLIADALVGAQFGAGHRVLRGLLAALAVLSIGLGGALLAFFREGYYAVAGAPAMAVLLALGGALALVSLWRRQFEAAVLTLAGAFVLFNYLLVTRALPDVERLKPVPPLAGVIAVRGSPDAALGFFNMDLPSLVYYAGRPVTKLGDADRAAQFFRDHQEVWVLAGAREWAALQPLVPGACVAASHPLFVGKGGDILRRRPPPDVLLITNKCQ